MTIIKIPLTELEQPYFQAKFYSKQNGIGEIKKNPGVMCLFWQHFQCSMAGLITGIFHKLCSMYITQHLQFQDLSMRLWQTGASQNRSQKQDESQFSARKVCKFPSSNYEGIRRGQIVFSCWWFDSKAFLKGMNCLSMVWQCIILLLRKRHEFTLSFALGEIQWQLLRATFSTLSCFLHRQFSLWPFLHLSVATVSQWVESQAETLTLQHPFCKKKRKKEKLGDFFLNFPHQHREG